MRVFKTFAVAAALACSAAGPASAAIIINVGPGSLQPDENILFSNNPTPAFIIEGVSNQTDTLVSFFGGETLTPKGAGQSRLDTTDTRISSVFTFRGFTGQLLGVDLSDLGLAFTSTEFRLFGGSATEATLTFVDTEGEVFQETFAIPANGFFSATTEDGQLIDYFSIATNGDLHDVRQVRIGGVQPVAVIPEAGAWAMMILGFGGVGTVMRRRRMQAV
jgi:hypothetical protein